MPAAPARRRMSARARALLICFVSLLVLVAVAVALPVPYVKVAPGPTYNTIGAYDDVPLVEIGVDPQYPTYPVTGHLDMTTVQEWGGPRGGLTIFQALHAWVDPDDAVLPRELLYPDDVSGDEVRRRNAVLFSTSQSHAIAAALRHLDIPVTQEVVATAVFEGSPSFGVINAGDRLLAIDGTQIAEPATLIEAIRAEPIGTAFEISLSRASSGLVEDVTVTSAANPDDASVPYIGLALDYIYSGPMSISFTLKDIGGPSAGLFFALAIVDKLSPEDLTGGRFIAGTGTIDPSGAVGPIGGIRQKLAGAAAAGATLFLMPSSHCDEAAGHIPDGMTVVPVDTLDAAIVGIEAWRTGAPVPTCPV